jgi:hypothetical protein
MPPDGGILICLLLVEASRTVVVAPRFIILPKAFLGLVTRMLPITAIDGIVQVTHVIIRHVLRISRIVWALARVAICNGVVIGGVLLTALVLICRHRKTFSGNPAKAKPKGRFRCMMSDV